MAQPPPGPADVAQTMLVEPAELEGARQTPVAIPVSGATSHADPRTTMRYEPGPGITRPPRHLHRGHVRGRRCPVTTDGETVRW